MFVTKCSLRNVRYETSRLYNPLSAGVTEDLLMCIQVFGQGSDSGCMCLSFVCIFTPALTLPVYFGYCKTLDPCLRNIVTVCVRGTSYVGGANYTHIY